MKEKNCNANISSRKREETLVPQDASIFLFFHVKYFQSKGRTESMEGENLHVSEYKWKEKTSRDRNKNKRKRKKKENKEEGRGGEKIFRVVKIFRERCLGRILRLVIHYLENNSERKLRIVMINEQELPSDIFNNERCQMRLRFSSVICLPFQIYLFTRRYQLANFHE